MASWPLWGLVAGILASAGGAGATIGDLEADRALGQTSFTDAVPSPIGPAIFGTPAGIAIDAVRDRVYVSDRTNHRVLGWANADTLTDGAPADLVIGQPDFVSWGCNRSLDDNDDNRDGITLASLCNPAGLAVDGDGALYVADSSSCRVLVFDDPFATDQVADRVLGQADGDCNGTYTNANRLFYPKGVAVDGAGNVFVVDGGQRRVLEFDGPLASTDTTADRVYGAPTFTETNGWIYNPYGISIDPSGRMYVGSWDSTWVFDAPLGAASAYRTADHYLGNVTCNGGGTVTAATTCAATGVATDAAGRLYLADAGNNRVLEFDAPLTVPEATRVFGQPDFGPPPGGMTSCGNETCNTGGPSASSLCLRRTKRSTGGCYLAQFPAVAVDGSGALWVADGFNHRVLRYDEPLTTDGVADLVLGHTAMTDTREPGFPLDRPSVGVYDRRSSALALEPTNSRILVYGNVIVSARLMPSGVVGQPDVFTTGCNTGGLSASSLCNPTAAVVADSRLWIADTGNNRVLRFDLPWFLYGSTERRGADQVYGQPDFTSNACALGASGLCGPQGVAFDANGTLYISDTGNNRVVHHLNPLADTTADRVYGQSTFDTRECTPGTGGAAALCDPRGIAVFSHVDAWGIDQGDDLFVADRGNNRVVLYESTLLKQSGAGADKVFGQGDDMDGGSPGGGTGGLHAPSAVAIDRGGNLLVADTDNNRVLEYDAPFNDTSADRVFGQADFSGTACNAGAASPTAESLCQPIGLAAPGTTYGGDVLVGDAGNNRVLRYQDPYCRATFSLTAANRHTPGLRSQPLRASVKIRYGTDPVADDDTFRLNGRLILLDHDGGIHADDPPLFTLATDSSFASGIVFQEEVPNMIDDIRVTNTRETVGTGELEADRGVTFYKLNISSFWPRGLSETPYFHRAKYTARGVGMDLSGFTASEAWLRAQFGSICFTTEMRCRSSSRGAGCRPAPATR